MGFFLFSLFFSLLSQGPHKTMACSCQKHEVGMSHVRCVEFSQRVAQTRSVFLQTWEYPSLFLLVLVATVAPEKLETLRLFLFGIINNSHSAPAPRAKVAHTFPFQARQRVNAAGALLPRGPVAISRFYGGTPFSPSFLVCPRLPFGACEPVIV